MENSFDKNFGVVIAFLIPGFLLLWGLSFSYSEISNWLANSSAPSDPTVGGFLYATLASLGLGLLISAVRWLIIDFILSKLDISDEGINYEKLNDANKSAAYMLIVENHYRYYQYYANSLIAILIAFCAYLFSDHELPPWPIWLLVALIVVVLFLGSKDSLDKCYKRAKEILKK